ncbi:outer membrane protein [Oryzicola mucosus]|uniref:Porin family protein n=1 Tax=Oryzicola mucosus TaxID=2767425 RepID=A0A8J6PF38_9HYPH|nr:outer membrane protein [Oryzicola mucosus]MBD0413929.1 porin family protein [Oryzicola mucosus]
MKKFLIASSFLVAFAGQAMAADAVVYEPSPAPEVVPAGFVWTGGYVGINGGYGGGNADHPFWADNGSETLTGSLDFTSSGFLGGAQLGYNYQMDRFVVGVEADIQAANVKGEGSLSLNSPALSGNLEVGTELKWFGTIRGRLGYAATDRFLVYGTGGAAYGETKSYALLNGDGVSEKSKKWGWTVGGGAEYAVTDNITFKTEYLYTDLGSDNLFSGSVFGADASIDRDFTFHTVRAGINYKF